MTIEEVKQDNYKQVRKELTQFMKEKYTAATVNTTEMQMKKMLIPHSYQSLRK